MGEFISKELKDFVKEGGVTLPKNLQIDDKEKRIYRRTVKLMEEVGEFSNAILSHLGRQRTEKLNNYNPDNLPEEFADVLITLLLIADMTEIDVDKAIELKMEKIRERFKK